MSRGSPEASTHEASQHVSAEVGHMLVSMLPTAATQLAVLQPSSSADHLKLNQVPGASVHVCACMFGVAVVHVCGVRDCGCGDG